MKRKVAVLIASYNGEKYIKEQINSILRQDDKYEIEILIRDDGSTDATIDVIKQIGKKNIKLYQDGTQKGAPMSFYDLILKSPDADFYAFADQDDVWKPTKLNASIQQLSKSGDKIAIYGSSFDVVDSDLHFIKKEKTKNSRYYTLGRTLIKDCFPGCTMVFNRALRDKLKEHVPKYIRMHDYYTMMVAEAFHGDIYCDEESQILYRQHGNNTVGFNHTLFERFKRYLRLATTSKNERQRQSNSLLECYYNELPNDSKDILFSIRDYKKSINNKLKLINDKRMIPEGNFVKILFYISVLTGTF